jgi:hypothetical protein
MRVARVCSVLVPVCPRDEQSASPQGQVGFDCLVLGLEVVLGMRRREAQRVGSAGLVMVTPEGLAAGAGIAPGTPSMRTK